MDNDRLWMLIRDRLEMDEVLDLCGIGINELSLRLRSNILENREAFENYLDIYDNGQVDIHE